MLEFLIITFLFIICLVALIYPILKPKINNQKLSYYDERKKLYGDIKKYHKNFIDGEINLKTYESEIRYLKLQAAKLIRKEKNNE
ncbi:MAG: hypothetical protein CL746_06255 [Chloroflexi bacterium]|nr:hypothetical protein [Chloroflexota bacterium]MBL01334.1 hypothetical protein [Chloroflexota bacterium]|tara:strand:+ start:6977 stop:7231 length:255 start_codon:yes stop_codon:yes gene_type:complete